MASGGVNSELGLMQKFRLKRTEIHKLKHFLASKELNNLLYTYECTSYKCLAPKADVFWRIW